MNTSPRGVHKTAPAVFMKPMLEATTRHKSRRPPQEGRRMPASGPAFSFHATQTPSGGRSIRNSGQSSLGFRGAVAGPIGWGREAAVPLAHPSDGSYCQFTVGTSRDRTRCRSVGGPQDGRGCSTLGFRREGVRRDHHRGTAVTGLVGVNSDRRRTCCEGRPSRGFSAWWPWPH
jgi:hypothetical protein